MISIILISINLMGYFTGTRLQGIPLGWMGAGFRFTTLSYLWSSDLWGSVKYKHASDYRAIKYNFAADQGHILVDSEVGTEDFRWRDFTAPMDGSWERVGLSSAWFDDLGAKVPVSPNQPNDTSVTTVESILNLALFDTLQRWGALQATELALAVTVVDGLSRSSSFLTSTYSAMLEPLVSHSWTAETAKKLVNLDKPKTAFSPEGAYDMVSVKLQMILPSYVMSARGWFDRLCMAILMAHALIALGHTFWVLWYGETSDAWESMTELIDLTLESDRPSSKKEPGLSNTSAGVRTWAPLKEVGTGKKVFSSEVIGDLEDEHVHVQVANEFDKLMLDKFIALDEDKCQFTYQLINAMGATNVVEAGTSFGVSTIYLALAVGKTKAATGKPGTVIATEKETQKAEIARMYWARCGPTVEQEIDLRVGNLLETLKEGLPQVDLLLLDIWSALALPTLKVVLPRLRYGAVVLTDNTISGAEGYKDLLAYLREPRNGFRNLTLPYTNGFEMSVYLPVAE
ncbi:hypothetical protein VDGE_01292 [Verticillium dahliae]|uniref:O-methyltransferase n=1 Tax=Verticillium dahliae TaxID=27337 RepID=A0A444RRK4_VERDA|nr:hypothetical protein VDGE_01292 [Verticillium dahliae]